MKKYMPEITLKRLECAPRLPEQIVQRPCVSLTCGLAQVRHKRFRLHSGQGTWHSGWQSLPSRLCLLTHCLCVSVSCECL